jgi:hypothetical protein
MKITQTLKIKINKYQYSFTEKSQYLRVAKQALSGSPHVDISLDGFGYIPNNQLPTVPHEMNYKASGCGQLFLLHLKFD